MAERRYYYGIPKKELDPRIQNVIKILEKGGRSQRTIDNYSCAINRFLKYFNEKDIEFLTEADIIDYIEKSYLYTGNNSLNTYNVNICAIRFFYSISFNKSFNPKLLPHAKGIKKLPTTITKEAFINILNNEKFLKHKCWLLLAYCSGLRAEEISTIKICDIDSKEHRLKILGKRKKERYTVLPNITIKYLRLYYKKSCKKDDQYLFKGTNNAEHINCKTIINYFTNLKKK